MFRISFGQYKLKILPFAFREDCGQNLVRDDFGQAGSGTLRRILGTYIP